MTKTKSPKSLPAARCVEFKNQTGEHTGLILEDRGLFWKVRDETGEEYQVKKTSITRQYEAESPDDAEPAPAPSTGIMSALVANLIDGNPAPAPAPAPTAAKPAKTKDVDPDLVTLAQLCAELKVVGRIARRRLRGSFGLVETGGRWEWKKDSAQLEKVRQVIAGTTPAPAAEAAADAAAE